MTIPAHLPIVPGAFPPNRGEVLISVPVLGKSIALLLAGTLLLGGCGRVFYYGSDDTYTDPPKLGFQWKPLSLDRPGGGRLSAAIVPGKGPDSGRGLVVQFHGNAQNITAHWWGSRWLVNRGWDLLVWDYSGYGLSDGAPDQAQVAKDADAFLSWVSDSILSRHSGPLVLMGQSLGAAILTSAYPRWKDRDRALLVVAESGFHSYRSIARDRVGLNWFTWPAWPLVPLLIPDGDAPVKSLGKIAPTPFLVVGCREDRVVPVSFQRTMHKKAKGSAYWEITGCVHGGAFKGDSTRTRFQRLVDSLARPVPPE